MVQVTCGEKCEEEDDVVATYEMLVRSTGKAVLVRFSDLQCWVPFSQIVDHCKFEKTIRVTAWFAEQEGVESDE